MKRTFIAIKIHLEDTVINFIKELQHTLKGEKIKWVDINNIHITLAFLGDTEKKSIEHIKSSLHEVALNNKQMVLKLCGFGVFKNLLNPRVLWIGVEKNDSLIRLHKNIANQLAILNYQPNFKFSPHLTLGRIKCLNSKEVLKEILDDYSVYYFQKSIIEEIIFYESILTPIGPIYKPLDIIPLN